MSIEGEVRYSTSGIQASNPSFFHPQTEAAIFLNDNPNLIIGPRFQNGRLTINYQNPEEIFMLSSAKQEKLKTSELQKENIRLEIFLKVVFL
jgi:hypothetical protein